VDRAAGDLDQGTAVWDVAELSAHAGIRRKNGPETSSPRAACICEGDHGSIRQFRANGRRRPALRPASRPKRVSQKSRCNVLKCPV
jgi:hypothetical protein